jgi:hypothetical protein
MAKVNAFAGFSMCVRIAIALWAVTLNWPVAHADDREGRSPGLQELGRELTAREALFGDRPFSARITYNERKRAMFKGGSFQTRVQVVDATWAGQDRARIDMIEEPAYSLGFRGRERIIMTSDAAGARSLTWARNRDPKEPDGLERKGSTLVGRTYKEKGLWWAMPPAELLYSGAYSPTDVLFYTGTRVQPPGIERIDGHETVRVEWSMDSMNPPGSAMSGVLWFARDLGYAMIRSQRSRQPTPNTPWKQIAESKYEKFTCVGGIWLPGGVTFCEHSYWDDGFYELKRELEVTFENWKVDEKLDEKFFRLEFPKGAWVMDHARGGSIYVKGRIDDPEIKRTVR